MRRMMAPAKILNAAILGCGAVSELYYMPALKELEQNNLVKVKALLDPNPARLSKLGDFFPVAAPFQKVEELNRHDIDFAIVASPPQYHAGQTIQLLQDGIHVLCEKPLALTLADAEAMVAAGSAWNRLLAVGLFRRFFPAVQLIQAMLSLDILGVVKTFTWHEGGIFQWPVQSASYFSRDTAQGGVLFDIGVHVLDLLSLWWGQPEEVDYEDDAMGGVEANCRIKLKFPQGFSGDVRLSRDCPLSNRLVIDCEKGWLSWAPNEAENVQIGFNNSDYALAAKLHGVSSENHRFHTLGLEGDNLEQSFIRQLSNVVSAIHGIEQLALDHVDAAVQRPADRNRQRALAPRTSELLPEIAAVIVIDAEHHPVARALVAQDPPLGTYVAGQAAVPLEVVRAHVQDNRHGAAQVIAQLQLIRGEFQHIGVVDRCRP